MVRTLAEIPSVIGKIKPPINVGTDDPQVALVKIANMGLNGLLIVAGLYTLLNIVLAGWGYITSAGDSKAVQLANQRITYTIVGIAIIAITPLIAAILGIVIFGHWDAILNPNITTLQDTSP